MDEQKYDPGKIGMLLKVFRLIFNLNQNDLAHMLMVGRTTLSEIESGNGLTEKFAYKLHGALTEMIQDDLLKDDLQKSAVNALYEQNLAFISGKAHSPKDYIKAS